MTGAASALSHAALAFPEPEPGPSPSARARTPARRVASPIVAAGRLGLLLSGGVTPVAVWGLAALPGLVTVAAWPLVLLLTYRPALFPVRGWPPPVATPFITAVVSAQTRTTRG